MKDDKVLLIKELVVTQMNYWVLFAIAVTILGVSGSDRPSMWLWLLCGLVPFAFFLCRRYITVIWLFILVHLVPIGLFMLLPSRNSVQKVVLVAAVIVAVVLSFYLRIRTEEQTDSPLHPVLAVGIIVAALFIQNYNGQKEWQAYYVGAVIVFIACYYVQYYIEQFFYFLIANKNSNGNIPEKEILSSGMKMTLLYTGLGVALLILIANVGWLASAVGQIKRLLYWILSLFMSDEKRETSISMEGAEVFPEEKEKSLLEQLGLTVETSKVWLVLEWIFIVLLIVGFLALVIFLLRKLILIMRDRFGKGIETQSVVIENGVDVREKCEIKKQSKDGRKKLPIFRNPTERIRAIYHKQVLAGKKQLVGELPDKRLGYLTAKECGDGLNLNILTEVYEKARYSSEESTMDDVRRLKAGI